MAHLDASDCCMGALGPVVKHTVLTSNETSLLVLVPTPRHSHMELCISPPLGCFSSGQQEQQHALSPFCGISYKNTQGSEMDRH